MKDTITKYVDFKPCTSMTKEMVEVSLCNNGRLLDMSICLKDVCPCKPIMLGVLVCYRNRPYALQTKEVMLENSCCKCCRQSCPCLRDLLVEGFEFIFPFEVCRQEVTIKVVAHYIF